MQVITIAAAALAIAAPLVEAANAIVYNKCKFPVYLWSVSSDRAPGAPVVLAANSGKYSEAYQTPSKGGVSIKIATSGNVGGPISQFEYTLDSKIWYDISNINCKGTACPFQPFGMYLHSGSGCPTVSCPGGEPLCSGAYNNPDDNWASLACNAQADTTVFLCAASAVTAKSEIPARAADAEAPASTLATVVRARAPEPVEEVQVIQEEVRAAPVPRHPHQRP